MSGQNASADALLTEHFRYTPLALIDDIINTVNAIVYRALSAIESGLLNTPPATLGFVPPSTQANDWDGQQQGAEAARAEIEDGVHKLETLLETTVDKNFDKFEIYTLRNILSIPDGLEKWTRLAHYENLALSLSTDSPSPNSIQILRNKLLASQTLSLALEAEHSTLHSILTDLLRLTALPTIKTDPLAPQIPHSSEVTAAPLSFLASSHATTLSSLTPFTTTSQFTVSQLPALRSLLSELRPKLQSLNRLAKDNGAIEERMDWEAPREERRAYVESEARRAVKGELGAVDGNGGEKGDLGVSRDQSEVEGLEGVLGRGELRTNRN